MKPSTWAKAVEDGRLFTLYPEGADWASYRTFPAAETPEEAATFAARAFIMRPLSFIN